MNYSRYADYAAGVLIVAAFILYFIVAINSPIVFGDEGYYATASRWMAKNLIIPEFSPLFETKIYHERFSVSKPVFFLYETFGYFFGGEWLVKILFALPVAVGAALLYLMAKRFYGWPAGIAAVILFSMTPSLVTYGVLGYGDVLFVMLALASMHFGMKAMNDGRKSQTIIAGVFTGLTILTKNSAMFVLLFFLLYFIFINNLKSKKQFAAIILLSLAISAPWLARNFFLYGSPCYWKLYTDEQCGPKYDTEVPKVSELQFEGRTQNVGTEGSLFKFGILNYVRFAYGWAVPIIFLFGLALAVLRKNNSDKITLLLLASILPLFYFSTQRAEDTARYMMPLIMPMALLGSAFVNNIFISAEKKHIALGAAILILVLLFSWPYGDEKLKTMAQVKQFIPGAFDACDWVKKNTQQDSIIFATYGSQIRYQCERKLSLARDAEEVMLGNESVSYEHLKLNGVKYIYVINGLITQQKLQENYPLSFVQMMQNSTHFKKVYDNTEKFGQASVTIFEVL